MTRRNTELLLLCIAAPLVILLFAMVAANQNGGVTLDNLTVPLGMFAVFVVAHLAVRKLAPGADPAILPISFALTGIGIAFITRLAPSLAMRQVGWLFLGVVFMVAVLALVKNLDKLSNYKYTIMIAGILLLISPMLPVIGHEEYGSRIWLSLGGFSFQPGEIAKICIVIFLAAYLSQNREMLSVFSHRVGPFHLPDPRALVPVILMWAVALLVIVFEKDLGSALVLFFVFVIMLYIATGKKSYVFISLGLIAVGFVAAYFIFSHVQVRVDTWLDPFADPTDTGYQLVQSIFSIADGGLFGVGIGNGLSAQIPVVVSDFIFSAIAEEAGLLGAAGLLLLYLCFCIRGILIAVRAKSDVSSFMSAGFTSVIVFQAFIIVGGVTRLIPLTGLTLPFVSQGGSSLLAAFIMMGFLMRASDQGTGLGAEITSGTGMISMNGALGRVSLGKRLTHVLVVFSLMFALLVANLTLIMVIQADYYQNMSINNHTLAKESKVQRGTISTYDNVLLAQSVLKDDGTYERQYPAGDLASHVVGYASDTYGTAGIESSCNDTLKGTSSYASWIDVLNSYAGNTEAGNDVKLTINSKVQQAAQDALEGYKGACVVMDPETGAVLALASSPTYDASDVESLLSDSSSSALYNRATQALYSPGSTFKIVTLETALENGTAKESTTFKSPSKLEIGGGEVTNFGGASYGDITLQRATELSSNTVFAQLGTKIGAEALVSSSEEYGFNKELDFDLPLAKSLMPDSDEMTEWETAWAAAGEPVGEHSSPAGPQATVLQMALVGCAIANDGTIMQPYLVDSVYNADGKNSFRATPSEMADVCSSSVAKRVRKVLEGVVNNGTGTAAGISGVQIAGKTGTAETGKEKDDRWFVGMGPSDNSSVVVAIVLEEAGEQLSGGAAGRAKGVFEAALEVQGDL